MATNFSPCKGSYVLNQFPSNVMFGMNGFHVSASGAIQGHHGPLVFLSNSIPSLSSNGRFSFLCQVYFLYLSWKNISQQIIHSPREKLYPVTHCDLTGYE